MRSDTQSVTIDADPGRVFAFVADGASLPRWAIGFAKSARPDGSGWVVSTAQGEVSTTIAADERTGTVDFRMEPAPEQVATAYARVVPNGKGAGGLVSKSAECRCDRRVEAALRNGRVQPRHLNFAQHLDPDAAVGEMERLHDLASLMHSHPDYQTPEAVTEAIKTVIASGTYTILQ